MAYAFGLKSRDSFPERFSLYVPDGIGKTVLPASWDYRYLFAAVDDQGDFQTCVAHAIKGLLDAIVRKRTGVSPAVSWRGVYSLAKHEYESDDLADDGLIIEDALHAVEQYGYPIEAAVPDAPVTEANLLQPVDPSALAHAHGIAAFSRVAISEETLALAIVHNGPVLVGLDWPQAWILEVGSDGVLPLSYGVIAGGHCVLLTGYAMREGVRYFEVRNSWGLSWGARGYGWLPASALATLTNAYTAIIP